jgi:hypothetical protein
MSPLEIRETKFWKIFREMMEGKRISQIWWRHWRQWRHISYNNVIDIVFIDLLVSPLVSPVYFNMATGRRGSSQPSCRWSCAPPSPPDLDFVIGEDDVAFWWFNRSGLCSQAGSIGKVMPNEDNQVGNQR